MTSFAPLSKRLFSTEDDVRLRALEALQKLPDEQLAKIVPVLLEGLSREPAYNRWYAAEAIGKLGAHAKEAAPVLAANLGHSEFIVRRSAAEALGNIGPAALDVIVLRLRELDAEPRHEATGSLRKMSEKFPLEVGRVLIQIIQDPSLDNISYPCVDILNSIGEPAFNLVRDAVAGGLNDQGRQALEVSGTDALRAFLEVRS